MIWVLIFGVIYPIFVVAGWSVGVMGICATAPERKERCWQEARECWLGADLRRKSYRQRYGWSVVGLSVLTFWMGILWPIAVPLYLASKKGTFIAQTIADREVQS